MKCPDVSALSEDDTTLHRVLHIISTATLSLVLRFGLQ